MVTDSDVDENESDVARSIVDVRILRTVLAMRSRDVLCKPRGRRQLCWCLSGCGEQGVARWWCTVGLVVGGQPAMKVAR